MISSSNVMVCNAFGLIGSLTVLTFLHFRCIVHNIPTEPKVPCHSVEVIASEVLLSPS
jgi:hypothetical protein